ncbi:MAG: glycosyltransferase family 4 protein [Elusimicrobia bacterium]|nr:glycosyltransferase family 4 protein [Elusimicrobiota bacterium]
MNILQIEDEPWDSGIAHYALTLSAQLRRLGHQVHFWGRVGSPLLDEARRSGLRALGLRRPWSRLRGLRAELRATGIELVNAHTGTGHALAAALAAGSGAALVRTRGDARPAAKHPLARLLARRTAAYIAANSAIARQLTAAFPGARVATVFQGIAAGPALPLPEEPVFGLLGRLDPVKGHETALQALALLRREHPEARLRVVGGAAQPRREALEARAKALGLEACVRFTGFVPDAAAELARCRVGVVASTGSEAVSRAALEWMAAGRPVAASRVGCLPDLVEEGATGFLFPPGDSAALTGVLARFLREPALAGRMGAAARRRYEERFSLERFGAETLKVYGKAIRSVPS